VIGALAAIENVFPPVPADSAVAIGAFLSAGGHVTAWGVFLVTWTANVAAAALVYAAARTVGRRFFRGPLGRRLLDREALARLERLYDQHGTWGIFVSRFVPGVRAIVPPFAGIAGLGAFRAVAPVAAASALWYGALTFAAATLVENLEQIHAFVTGFGWGALALGLTLVAAAIVLLVRRRRRRAAP
jgi:membrane protein DedA with SNARE-associated domain